MPDYQKTKIYKIESNKGDKCYIGATTKNYLSQRYDTHRGSYKRWKAGTGKYIISFELFNEYGIENCKIILLESYPCKSKDESNAKEAEYIKKEFNCINNNIPNWAQKQNVNNEQKIEAVI